LGIEEAHMGNTRVSSTIIALSMAGLVASWGAGTSRAEGVAFGFRGTVTDVFDGLLTLNNRVSVGTPFWGAYIFESTTPNTAPPGGEGEFGLYHHDRRPAGVFVNVGGISFFSDRRRNFDIIVNNDVGFVGADEYGFFSYANRSRPTLRGDLLHVSWFVSTFQNQVFNSPDLPLDPPDLSLLGGGEFKIYGECTPCASPTAFYRITGPVTSLVELPMAHWSADGPFDYTFLEWEISRAGSAPTVVPEPVVGGLVGSLFALWMIRETWRPRGRGRSRAQVEH
jgi:hypothetical protein